MKLASAASPTDLINGAENLTKNTNEDGVVYIFLKCIYIFIYIFILTVSLFKNSSVLLVFLVLATTNSFRNC